MSTHIRIGSRGSKLALWQANHIRNRLQDIGVQSDIIIIKTKGDAIQHLSFDKMEGKGFFTKEIEQALLSDKIDLAVHSMKDLQTTQPEGLIIAALTERSHPADMLVLDPAKMDDSLVLSIRKNGKIGTSSARRKSQIRHFRPDLELVDIRGNVPTRIAKIKEQELDGIIIAAAGVRRLQLDLSDYHTYTFNPKEFVSAPAQGVLGLQVRASDIALRKILRSLHDEPTARKTNIERGVLKKLGGGCQTPLGVYCEQDDQLNYHVWVAFAKASNHNVHFIQESSATSHQLTEHIVTQIKSFA